jgi:hypothetical protein
MGVLANHVPVIEPLKPGVIEIIEGAGSSKKWFGRSYCCETVSERGKRQGRSD